MVCEACGKTVNPDSDTRVEVTMTAVMGTERPLSMPASEMTGSVLFHAGCMGSAPRAVTEQVARFGQRVKDGAKRYDEAAQPPVEDEPEEPTA